MYRTAAGLNKKVIIMTRACFNKLCIVSRKARSVHVADVETSKEQNWKFIVVMSVV